ncbi:MAG: flippase-like domain-containing protein [Spirochaetes bacterium]|nr:flippase-like domain-containing protein [Spirochaetota bacterium]
MRIPVNIRRFLIILAVSFVIIGLIIYFTATKQTLVALKNINLNFVLLAIFFYILEFTADAVRTKILIHGTHHKLKLWECFKLVALQVFFDLITPFSVGGQPFQIYILHKKKVPGGNATTVVVMKLLFGALALTSIVIFGLLFYSRLFVTVPILVLIVKVTGLILLFIAALFVLGLYNPAMSTVVITFIIKILWKLKISHHPDKLKNKIMKHILLARNSFNGFVSHRFLYFFIGLVLSFVMILSMIMMILCFLWGFQDFGVAIPVDDGIILTAALIFIITFMPTPGSSGLGEGIFYLLYNQFIPAHLIGLCIFLWRFFTQYLTAMLGAVVTAKYFSELLMNKKIAESG